MNEHEYLIENGIPIPEVEERKSPLLGMEIGDSFFIPLLDWIVFDFPKGGFQRAANFYASGRVFAYRPVCGQNPGFRVWRVK